MKKYIIIGISVLFALSIIRFLTKPREEKAKKFEDISINVTSAKVSGDLENIISVVDGKYKVTKTETTTGDLLFPIKLKINSPISNKKELEELRVQFIDENGMPIPSIHDFYIAKGLWSSSSEVNKLNTSLIKGNGDINVILDCVGVISEDDKNKVMEEIIAKAKNISVTTSISEIVNEELTSSKTNSRVQEPQKLENENKRDIDVDDVKDILNAEKEVLESGVKMMEAIDKIEDNSKK
jgi:hypothetical protein